MIRISWTPAWRQGWHTAARALLAGFAAIGIAQAQPALHSIAPAPFWVLPMTPEAGRALPAEQVGRGVQYLLLDKQVRVSAQDRTTFQHVASKVLNEQGLENAANIEIRFDPSYQKLSLHAINVRRGAQVIAKLASAKVQILQRESALESLIFDGSRTAHVFLEDVRVGDVIEYAYSLRGSNPVFGNRHFGGFDFQFSAPVDRLHARLLWPAGRPLYWKQLNEPPAAQVTQAGDSREYRWDLRDIAPKTVESDAPAWFDPYPSSQWSEFQSWQSVAAWAMPLYALPPIPGPRVLAVTNQIAQSQHQAPERLLAALHYVQSQVRYLGIEVGPGSHAPNPPELVLERRYGDCKDKTLLTVALLRGLGIAAQPALVHTNARHTIESQQPGPGAFNHVVVHARIGNRDIWLDPTRSPQRGGLDQLAQADFGRALIVDASTLGLVPMAGRQALASKREIHAVIDSTDGLDKPARYTVTTTARGAAADSLRNALDTQS
ncbi:MAG TPA: DUF3857 domain-containing protein, partial [Ideonella sp.]|nr:DUF3857 domain-containing protein [Ideonella sp.]